MKRKHTANSARRNLALVVAIVLALAILATAVRWLNVTPPVIMPEGREEIAANRRSPDNGYPLLQEAARLYPPAPPRVNIPIPDRPELKIPYQPEPDAWFALLDVPRPIGDPEFTTYLHAADPVIAKAREALNKPFCLQPEPDTLFDQRFDEGVYRLPVLLVARGYTLAKFENAPGEAVAYFVDGLRLTRVLTENCSTLRFYFRGSPRETIGSIIRELAREVLAETDIEAFQRALDTLGPPFADRKIVIENSWRIQDESLLQPVPNYMRRFPENLLARHILWRMARASREVIENKAEYYGIAEKCTCDVLRWLSKEQRDLMRNPWEGWLVPRCRSAFMIARACGQQADYEATRLALALERFHKAKGAYPEKLDELVPAFIRELPQDPISCLPFGYHKEGELYVLYSAGTDARDNGGATPDFSHGRGFDFTMMTNVQEGTDQIFVAPPGAKAPLGTSMDGGYGGGMRGRRRPR